MIRRPLLKNGSPPLWYKVGANSGGNSLAPIFLEKIMKPRFDHQKLYGFQCHNCKTMHVLSHMFWNTVECKKCGKNISNPKKEHLREKLYGKKD